MATKGKSLLNRRDNQTINTKLEQSQARVAGLLAKLEDRTGSFDSKEVAFMQANITDLMGRFEDSATDMQHEINDVLESFMKGTLTPEELHMMINGEKERGAYATTMMEEINTQLENMFSFVANYLNDVERGKPLPNDSFKSLYQELDYTMDKIHSVKKVIHTPSTRVQDVLKMVEKADEERIKSRAESLAYVAPITSFSPVHAKQHSWKNNFTNERLRRSTVRSPEVVRRNTSMSSSRPSSREDPNTIVYMDITGTKPSYGSRAPPSPSRRVQRPSQMYQFDTLSLGDSEESTTSPNAIPEEGAAAVSGVATSRRKSSSRGTVIHSQNVSHSQSHSHTQSRVTIAHTQAEDTPVAPMKSARIANIPSASARDHTMTDATLTQDDELSVGSGPSLESKRPGTSTSVKISRFNSDESNPTPPRMRSYDNTDDGSDNPSPKHGGSRSIKRQWSTESQKGRVRRDSSMSGIAQVPAEGATGASTSATLALLAKEEKLLKIERDLKARSDNLEAEVQQRVKALLKEKAKEKKANSPNATPRRILRKDSRSQSKKLSPMPSRKVLKASSSNVSTASASHSATPPRPQRKLLKQESAATPTTPATPVTAAVSVMQTIDVKNIVSGILSYLGPMHESPVKPAGVSTANAITSTPATPADVSRPQTAPAITDEITSRPGTNIPTAPATDVVVDVSQPTTRPGTTTSAISADSAVPHLSSPPLAPVSNMLLPLNDSLDCETLEDAKTTRSHGMKSGRALKLPDLVIPTHPGQMTDIKRQGSGFSSEVPMSPLSVNSAVVPNLTIEPRSNNAKLNALSEHNEIWVPPPSHILKKVPNTVLIFPLRTADQSTMTDPLPEPATVVPEHGDIEITKEVSAENSVSTIQPDEGPSFQDYLRNGIESSENPLLFLYETFRAALPELHRVSFLQATTCNLQDTYSTKNKAFAALFENVYNDLQRIEYSIINSLNVIQSCEESMRNVIVVLESKPEITTAFYDKIDPIAKSLGDIEVARAWVDMLLSGYRSIFTRISSLRIPSNVLGPYFDRSYQLFGMCQGGCVNITNNLNSVKKKFDKYLSEPLEASRPRPASPHHHKERRRSRANLEEMVSDLKEALHEAQDEIDELKVELFNAMSGVDRTPGALLFFSALHDPHLPEYLNQTVVNIDALRGAVSGKAQFDFQVIKRRLETAFLGLPSLQRFLHRYSVLYQRWNERRVKVFANRNIIGSSADNNSICPLCNIDARKHAPAGGNRTSNLADDSISVASGQLHNKISPKKTKNVRKDVLGPVDKRIKETLLSMSSVKY